jgi:hypothetical protein
MSATRHGPALVRLSCARNLGEFEQPSPRRKDLVWCKLCGTYRRVTVIIVASHKGGDMCGKRGKWTVGGHVVEVVCTEPPGHPPTEQHYDSTFNAFFPDTIGQRKPGRKVKPGRALPRREDELVFTAL